MSAYSIWPFFACVSIVLLAAWTPLFAPADTPPNPQLRRLKTLDGLRGFLALAVVFHHAAIYHDFFITGTWAKRNIPFYSDLGFFGVDIFFMITGYLFWSRMIREQGRPDWLALYIGRVFRIGPLFLVAFAVVAFIVFVQTGFAAHVRSSQLISQLGVGLFLGLVSIKDINGYQNTMLLLNGVTWTLQFEWFFYVGLILIAWAARSKPSSLTFVLFLIVAGGVPFSLFSHSAQSLLVTGHIPPQFTNKLLAFAGMIPTFRIFLYGMLTASLQQMGFFLKIPAKTGSVLVIILFAGAFSLPDQSKVSFLIILGLAFYLITSGCSVFGLLVSRPALRLGDVSFGIYLLQGLPQALLYRPGRLRALDMASPYGHWVLTLIAALLLIAMATAAHVLIERPGIEAGKRVVYALRARWPRRSGSQTQAAQ